MAVQKSRKTPSRRGMRRAHDQLTGPTLSVDAGTGETHRRHHVTADGYYRGRRSSKSRKSRARVDRFRDRRSTQTRVSFARLRPSSSEPYR